RAADQRSFRPIQPLSRTPVSATPVAPRTALVESRPPRAAARVLPRLCVARSQLSRRGGNVLRYPRSSSLSQPVDPTDGALERVGAGPRDGPCPGDGTDDVSRRCDATRPRDRLVPHRRSCKSTTRSGGALVSVAGLSFGTVRFRRTLGRRVGPKFELGIGAIGSAAAATKRRVSARIGGCVGALDALSGC